MPCDLNDPQFLRFMTESMDKEREMRSHWFNKNKKRIIEAAQLPKHHKEVRAADRTKASLEIFLPGLSKDHQNNIIHCRKKPVRDGPVLGLSSLSSKQKKINLDPIMFPVDPTIENIHKKPGPEGGRKQYLIARNCLSPEDKYYMDETSNNVYGWRVKESLLSPQAPKFRRCCTFMRSVYARTGPHADPSYYKQPPREPYNKCEAPAVLCIDPEPLRVKYK